MTNVFVFWWYEFPVLSAAEDGVIVCMGLGTRLSRCLKVYFDQFLFWLRSYAITSFNCRMHNMSFKFQKPLTYELVFALDGCYAPVRPLLLGDLIIFKKIFISAQIVLGFFLWLLCTSALVVSTLPPVLGGSSKDCLTHYLLCGRNSPPKMSNDGCLCTMRVRVDFL